MSSLTEFLNARLDEDQAAATAAANRASGKWFVGRKWNVYEAEDITPYGDEETNELVVYGNVKSQSEHIARHDPARVLRDVAARRKLIERHTTGISRTYHCPNSDHIQEWQCERAGDPYDETRYCEICPDGWNNCDLHILAAAFANHPDCDESWRA